MFCILKLLNAVPLIITLSRLAGGACCVLKVADVLAGDSSQFDVNRNTFSPLSETEIKPGAPRLYKQFVLH